MSRFLDALRFDPRRVQFLLYAVFPPGSAPAPPAALDGKPPFELIDDDARLGGRRVYLYELFLVDLPQPLEAFLRALLTRVIALGAELAWMAFEASFHFDHLFTPDIADQVYAIQFRDREPRFALDDATQTSASWHAEVAAARARLGLAPVSA